MAYGDHLLDVINQISMSSYVKEKNCDCVNEKIFYPNYWSYGLDP